MNGKITELCQKIIGAVNPDEIFKGLRGRSDRNAKLKAIEKEFNEMMIALSVDLSGIEAAALEKINEAKSTLEELYRWAKTKVVGQDSEVGGTVEAVSKTKEEVSVKSNEVKITTKKRDYFITEAVVEGDLALVYRGYYSEDGTPTDVVLKITKDPADNSFAKKEAEALELLYSEPNNESRQLKHLPKLIDQFMTADGQRGNILTYLDGYDLSVVKAKYKKGVDRKHMVWMLNRGLSLLGYAQSRGIVHGNITPSNWMLRPRDHNAWIIDWGYSIINPSVNGAKFSVFDEDFSAPEIELRSTLPPASGCSSQLEALYLDALFSADIYSVGKCMIYILGGDVKTNKMPNDVEEPLQRLLKSFVIESPLQRPRDAWEMHAELRKIITALWGKREFLEFRM